MKKETRINMVFDCINIHSVLELPECSNNALYNLIDDVLQEKDISYLEAYGIMLEFYKYSYLRELVLRVLNFSQVRIYKIIVIGHQLEQINLDNDIKEILIEKLKNIVEE